MIFSQLLVLLLLVASTEAQLWNLLNLFGNPTTTTTTNTAQTNSNGLSGILNGVGGLVNSFSNNNNAATNTGTTTTTGTTTDNNGGSLSGVLNGVGGLVNSFTNNGNNAATTTNTGTTANTGSSWFSGLSSLFGGLQNTANTGTTNTGTTTSTTSSSPDIGGILNGVGGLLNSGNTNTAATTATTGSTTGTGILSSGGNWLSSFFGGANTTPTTDTTTTTTTTGAVDTSGQQQAVVAQPQTSTKTGVGSACSGTPGVCQDIELESCSTTRLRGKCPGPNTVMCCPTASSSSAASSSASSASSSAVVNNNVQTSTGAGGCSAYAGVAFPLASGSLREISVNWGGSRSNGARCHAGLDIYTSGASRVQAVAAGVVTGIAKNWYSCSGGTIDAIFVYHESGPLAGKTVNYGEVNPGTYSVGVGSRVSQGQDLGVASRCGMLHFELYEGRRSANLRWMPATSVGSGCTHTSMSTKPGPLLDPRPLVRCTMPSGARFRNGIGFLNEAPDAALSLANDEEAGGDFDDGQGGAHIGAIIGGVIGALVLIVGVMALLLVVKSRRNAAAVAASSSGLEGGVGISVANELHGTATPQGTLGDFACQQCGKQYNYAEDLDAHMAARH